MRRQKVWKFGIQFVGLIWLIAVVFNMDFRRILKSFFSWNLLGHMTNVIIFYFCSLLFT